MIDAIDLEGIADASFTNGITSGVGVAASLSGARYAAQGAAAAGGGTVNITVNTGVGDPNAIAEVIEDYVRGAIERGTLAAR
jgi:hypothetical protein